MDETRDRDARRISKAAWIEAAHQALVSGGVDAVRIMPLARLLGVSRTSFYWYFTDRAALLEAVLELWEAKNTGNLVRRAEAYADTLTEAMFNLFDCWLDDALFDAGLDRAVRGWGHADASVGARVARADATRKAAIIAMFARFGVTGTEAEARAMTVLYTQVGYISMRVEEPFAERIARMPDYAQVYTGQMPSEAEIRRFRARHRALIAASQ